MYFCTKINNFGVNSITTKVVLCGKYAMEQKIYSISYDLRQPGRDYTELYDAIKGCDASFQHPLESNWYIRSTQTANEIYKILRPYIDEKDLLFVVEIKPNNRQGWMLRTFWDWIKKD